MKTIPLTQGKEALVDDCDYDYLMQWKWRFLPPRQHQRTGYAARSQRTGGKRRAIYMHRLVAEMAGLETSGKEIDHRDHDGLNNRRTNLRTATVTQNHANVRGPRNNTSGFKGVSWNRGMEKFQASIRVARHLRHLGYFDDPRDGARAYNEAALKHFGEFACLNPV